MALTPLILSRLQFAFTISYHIIFPSFSIGLAAWLTVLEGLNLFTRRPVYRRLFDFWLKIFAVGFGLGVVSGIVMPFEFGTNWSRLSAISGPIQGPLLAYESFTAFALEASFFGVLMFGRPRLPPVLYFVSVAMVSLGTTFSAFWIMVNNSWMQAPVGYVVRDGVYVPTDWAAIIFSPVVWVRFPHMLLGAYLAGAFCVAATGAWYRLRRIYAVEGQTMLRMGLYLASILIPLQLLFGHFNGDYVHDRQPTKFAAIEARWHDEQPAAEVLLALPDSRHETNHFELKVPVLGSLVATMTLNSKEVGLTRFARADRPPIEIPFFAFRVMVGCGLLMMALAWGGALLMIGDRLERSRLMLRAIFLSFPLPFIAILTGWFTAEVGRQPWTVYGVLRTAQAVTPTLTTPQAVISLAVFVCIHALIFTFGTIYTYRLLEAGPTGTPPAPANPKRPLAVPGASPAPVGEGFEQGLKL
ncbi:MAG: cytochrome ubiquinol oxidase subunit I [Caulobacteraceae bacterium]